MAQAPSPEALLLDALLAVEDAAGLPAVLQRIVDATVSMTGAERGFVALRGAGNLDFWAARNLQRSDVEQPDFQVSHKLVEEALSTGEAVKLDDAADARKSYSSILRIGVRSILALPLLLSGGVKSVLYLDHRQTAAFDMAAVELVRRFGEPIRRILDRAIEHDALARQAARLRRELSERHRFDGLVGSAPAFLAVLDTARRVAASRVAVLIQGESGTGKELVARAIHHASERADAPFVPVNCGALPEGLIESELFGHERGAFSGAVDSRPGRFEAASGGTLFLDEVGELPAEAQAKLLRAIQFGEVQRLGGLQPSKVDVRILAATHHDLETRASAGGFREDLYFRLAAVVVRLPPLRERPDDIPVLARHFLAEAARREDKGVVDMSPEFLRRLREHAWPGNLRELENIVSRAVLLVDGNRLTEDSLPSNFGCTAVSSAETGERHSITPPSTSEELKAAKDLTAAQLERAFVEYALRRAQGNVSEAARITHTHRSYFQDLIQRHAIKAHAYKG